MLDFRAFNDVKNVTQFDAGPMAIIEEDLHRFKETNFITKLDLCKVYFQFF